MAGRWSCRFRARPANLTKSISVGKALVAFGGESPWTTKPRPGRTRLAALGAPGSRCRSGCPRDGRSRPSKDLQCNLRATPTQPAPTALARRASAPSASRCGADRAEAVRTASGPAARGDRPIRLDPEAAGSLADDVSSVGEDPSVPGLSPPSPAAGARAAAVAAADGELPRRPAARNPHASASADQERLYLLYTSTSSITPPPGAPPRDGPRIDPAADVEGASGCAARKAVRETMRVQPGPPEDRPGRGGRADRDAPGLPPSPRARRASREPPRARARAR